MLWLMTSSDLVLGPSCKVGSCSNSCMIFKLDNYSPQRCFSAFEMTYIVSSGALNSTHSLPRLKHAFAASVFDFSDPLVKQRFFHY